MLLADAARAVAAVLLADVLLHSCCAASYCTAVLLATVVRCFLLLNYVAVVIKSALSDYQLLNIFSFCVIWTIIHNFLNIL